MFSSTVFSVVGKNKNCYLSQHVKSSRVWIYCLQAGLFPLHSEYITGCPLRSRYHFASRRLSDTISSSSIVRHGDPTPIQS